VKFFSQFVDDTILTKLITPSYSPSSMTNYLSSLLIWTADNDMQLNTFKTKEMILGRTDSTSIPSFSTPASPIRYLTFIWTLVYPRRPTWLNIVVFKPANIYWNDWREQASHHTNCSIFRLQASAQFSGTPPQSGTIPSLALKPTNWNQSKNEQYIIFSDTRGMSYPNVLFVANVN